MKRTAGIDIKRLWVVSGLGVCQLIAFGTSLYLLTVLSAAIVRETHWALGWVVSGYSLGVLVSATIAAGAGRFIGAGQGNLVLAASSLLFASGLLLMSVAGNLFVYGLSWCVMGMAMGCGLYDAAFGTVGRLYGASARASIIQIALWGGFASTVFWPLSSYLSAHMGWRGTCQFFAALHLCVTLPIYLCLPKPADAAHPREAGAQPRVQPEGREWPLFIALGLVVTCEMAIVSMISVHLQTLLQSRGLTPVMAVSLSTLIGPSQVFARVLELTIGRKWPPYASMVLGIVAVTTGIILLSIGGTLSAPALMIYGAGLGVVSITTGTVPLALFGAHRYPPLMGRIRRISLVMQALAPALGAWLMSTMGVSALLIFILILTVICLGMAIFLARGSHRYLADMKTAED